MFDNFLFLYADKSMHEIEAELFQNIQNTRHEKYGPQTNPAIAERIRQEWHAMEGNENALDVAIADSSRPPPQLCQHCRIHMYDIARPWATVPRPLPARSTPTCWIRITRIFWIGCGMSPDKISRRTCPALLQDSSGGASFFPYLQMRHLQLPKSYQIYFSSK